MSVKFDETKRAKYLALLREGGRRGASAEQAGVSIRTVQRALGADREFALDVSDAEGRAHEMVEDALFRRALDGNTTAQIFYLTNRSPNRWQDRRAMGKLELSGTGAGPVEIAALRARGRELIEKIAYRESLRKRVEQLAQSPAELPPAAGPEVSPLTA